MLKQLFTSPQIFDVGEIGLLLALGKKEILNFSKFVIKRTLYGGKYLHLAGSYKVFVFDKYLKAHSYFAV